MQNKETNNRRGISAQTQNMSTTNKCRRVDSPAKWQQKFGSGKQKQTVNETKKNERLKMACRTLKNVAKSLMPPPAVMRKVLGP